jgi:CRISPR-associated endonuclease/helicase Cas3
VEVSAGSEKTRIVNILHEQNDQAAIDLVIEKAEQGEQVLWIENTIADAQNVFQQLSCRVDCSQIECGLIHSRYIKSQRQIKEDTWVSMYGKESGGKRNQKGRILVGTQVLEQSIDIDADFMVTRICPTDMLLQRIGRLWRHSQFDGLRPVNSKQQVLILSPLYKDVLVSNKPFGKSSKVYSEYVLCRSLELWEPLTCIILPDDIRSLLEKTYAEREETGHLQKLKTELISLREKLRHLALLGLSTEINTLPETQAQTRYSDMETIDVLLIRSITKSSDDHILRFLDGTELIVPSKCYNAKQKREIAGTIMLNTEFVNRVVA